MTPAAPPTALPKLIAAPFVLVFLWLLLVIGGSIFFRRSRGKPVLFFGVPDARFLDRTGSGCSNRNWWTRLNGASRCLVVAVTADRLVICPFFPFNLMFIPEMYGLDVNIPLRSVFSVTEEKRFMRRMVRLRFKDGEREGDVSVYVSDPDRLQQCLNVGGG